MLFHINDVGFENIPDTRRQLKISQEEWPNKGVRPKNNYVFKKI